jgi:hypothetical protein
MMVQSINLADLTDRGTVRNLAGRDRGAAGRRQLNLDVLDRDEEQVVVHIPPDQVLSIADSFVQELFGPSISHLSGVENFLRKYLLDAHPSTKKFLIASLRRAASPRTSVFDLN